MKENLPLDALILTIRGQKVLLAAKLMPHDDALQIIWRELQPLLAPPPKPPQKEMGFHVREDGTSYRTKAAKRPKPYAKKNPVMQVADVRLDPMRRTVQRGDRTVDLTALEHRLLEYLFYRAGEVVSRTDIWERVFEDSSGGSSNTVDVYIGYQ